MTPKEKAFELAHKFRLLEIRTSENSHMMISMADAKQCALITVDEMIGELACARTKDDNLTDEEIEILDINIDKRQDYLIIVEKEIKKL